MNTKLINADYSYINSELQAATTPSDSLEALKAGNKRFVERAASDKDYDAQIKGTSTGQFPHAVVLSCIDSRVPTELVFDQGIGDIFNARVAGNIVNEDVLGSIEYACKVAGSKLVVVLGHTSCGAVGGAVDDVQLGNITALLSKIKPAIEAVKSDKSDYDSMDKSDKIGAVVDKNVELTIEKMKKDSPLLNEMYESEEIDIVGAVYDIKTGHVHFS